MAVASWLGVFVLVALAASQVVLEEDYDNQRNCLLTKYGPMKVSKLCVSLGSKKMVAWGQKKKLWCLPLSLEPHRASPARCSSAPSSTTCRAALLRRTMRI
jgi:hypothetical protein